MKLKPVTADVWLKYICPKCGTEHWAQRADTEFPGGTRCYCNEKLEFELIKHIEVKPLYETPQPKRVIGRKVVEAPAQSVKIETDEVKTKTVNALILLGYKKGEAARLVEQKAKVIGYTSEDELLKEILGF